MKISQGFGTLNFVTKFRSVGLRLREFSPQRAGRLSLTACKRFPLFVKFPRHLCGGFLFVRVLACVLFLCAVLCAGIHFFTKSGAGVLRFALCCLRVYDYFVIK